MLDQSGDSPQTRLEGRKHVRRFLGDVQKRLDDVDESLFLGCELSGSLARSGSTTGDLTRTWACRRPPARRGSFSKNSGHGDRIVRAVCQGQDRQEIFLNRGSGVRVPQRLRYGDFVLTMGPTTESFLLAPGRVASTIPERCNQELRETWEYRV